MNLVLQETTLPPGTEWRPPSDAWWFVRVVHGAAYWLGRPTALGLDPGSLLVIPGAVDGCIRASLLAPTRIAYYGFMPDTIVGVFTVSERHQVALPPLQRENAARVFPPGHPLAVEFSSLTLGRRGHTSLIFRCHLLGFAVRVLNSLDSPPQTTGPDLNPVVATRQLEILVKRLSDADLVRLTGEQLAQHCGCSVRHFRRLFRQLIGTSLQEKQCELRMLKAKQLLVESDLPIVDVALACGFHHQSLFHSTFKSWFGATPGQWRSHNRIPDPSADPKDLDGAHSETAQPSSLH